MIISVSQEKINNGKKSDFRFCPIALTLKELFPDKDVYVTGSYIRIDGIWTEMSKSMRDWIMTFDLTDKAKPKNFRLKLNDQFLPELEGVNY